MNYDYRVFLMRLWKVAHVALVTLTFALLWTKAYLPLLTMRTHFIESVAIVALFLALYVMFLRIYEAFLVSQSRISELIGSQFLSAVLADLFLYVIAALMMHRLPPLLPMLATLAGQSLIAVIWSYWAHQWYFRVYPPVPSAMIYADEDNARAFMGEYGLSKRYHFILTAHVSDLEASLDRLQGIRAVFLSDVQGFDRDLILKYCIEHSVEVYIIPCIGDLIMGGAVKVHMFHFPALRLARYHPRPEYLIVKRLFDVLVSLSALLALSPLMLITALVIRLYDRGPALYHQTRLTRDGKPFDMLKFRSMRTDAEKDGVARLSSGKKDARVTPVGRVIRKYRIDELPQLLNILKGDLSIVGPRPERPEIAAQYEETLPEFRLRLQAKAGLTGYAQVYGKYNTDPYHKLQMDLMYIANPSFLEDLRICFATIKVLFQAESTEGVAEGMTHAASATRSEAKETANV